MNKIGKAGRSPGPGVLRPGAVPCPIPGTLSAPRPHGRRARPWSADDLANIAAWVAAGQSQSEMARQLGITKTGFKLRADKLGIHYVADTRAVAVARGIAVLREHYTTNPDTAAVLALYRAATGRPNTTPKQMSFNASRMKLRRPRESKQASLRAAHAANAAAVEARRAAAAERIRAFLADGGTITQARAAFGHGEKMIARMRRDGLLPQTVRSVKAPKPPHVKAAPKPRPVKAPKTARVVVYAEPKPVKPKPVYQTVEAWLAAGNTVTRCPTAMAAYSPHIELPEADRAAMVAIHAARAAEVADSKPGDAVRRIMRLRTRIALRAQRMRA